MKNLDYKSEIKKWTYAFLGLLFIGLLNFSIVITDKLIYDDSTQIIYPLVNELTGALTLIFILPFLFWFFKKYSFNKNNFYKLLPIYLLLTLVFGIVHTTFMTWSRQFIYMILNIGVYDPGSIFYRYVMEYQKQFISFWFIYGIYFLVISTKEKQDRKIKEAELKRQLSNTQLSLLQSQLNPHFLFNTLNMISSKMYENPKSADVMISSLSDFLRVTLKNTHTLVHSLRSEIEVLNIYLKIMLARFDNKLNCNIDIPEKIMNAQVPWLILQPIVENSIKYSFENLKDGKINISAYNNGDILEIYVFDNGPGITKPLNEIIDKGTGIKNIIERLRKLYNKNYKFDIYNANSGGVIVEIKIPFTYSQKAKV